MANILLISDQERLIQIFTSPGFLPDAKVHVARTIDQALAAQTHDRHRFILIQERLGEISGHILAHRLAVESTGKKPRIIMLGGEDREADSIGKQVQTIQSAGLNDEDIAAAAREFLAGQEQKPRKRRNKPIKKPTVEPAADIAAIPLPAVEMVDDVVEIGKTSAHTGVIPVSRLTGHESTSDDPARSPFQKELESALGETDAAAPVSTGKTADQGIRPAPLLVKWGKAPLTERVRNWIAGRKFPVLIIVAAAIAITLALVTITLREKTPGFFKAEKKPAAQGFAEKPASAGITGSGIPATPSFIPQRSMDAAYGKIHPGWERYLTAATEFRVYRAGRSILAIQIIDRSGQGVQTGLFTSALHEIASSRQYLVEGRERKGTFLIEKGRLANGAKIIVYRNMPENRVKALVIEMH